jgi:hypothetical protein
MREAKSSGDEAPAAMNVAPATSSGMESFSHSTLSAGTKKSSQTMWKPTNMYIMRKIPKLACKKLLVDAK